MIEVFVSILQVYEIKMSFLQKESKK